MTPSFFAELQVLDSRAPVRERKVARPRPVAVVDDLGEDLWTLPADASTTLPAEALESPGGATNGAMPALPGEPSRTYALGAFAFAGLLFLLSSLGATAAVLVFHDRAIQLFQFIP